MSEQQKRVVKKEQRVFLESARLQNFGSLWYAISWYCLNFHSTQHLQFYFSAVTKRPVLPSGHQKYTAPKNKRAAQCLELIAMLGFYKTQNGHAHLHLSRSKKNFFGHAHLPEQKELLEIQKIECNSAKLLIFFKNSYSCTVWIRFEWATSSVTTDAT